MKLYTLSTGAVAILVTFLTDDYGNELRLTDFWQFEVAVNFTEIDPDL